MFWFCIGLLAIVDDVQFMVRDQIDTGRLCKYSTEALCY